MADSADVVVVGGGVIGSAVACELAQRGVQVMLLDRTLPGRATSASAGGLWPLGEAIGLGCGVIYHAAQTPEDDELLLHPPQLPTAFRDFLLRSNDMFATLHQQLQDQSGVDIEYQKGPGLLFLIFDEAERNFVDTIAAVLPTKNHLRILSPDEVHCIEPRLTRDLLGAALIEGEYQVNPMALAEAFKRAAIRNGAEFRHEVRATRLQREGTRIVGVEAGDQRVSCSTVVNACGAWSGTLAASAGLNVPVFPVRGQIVLTDALPQTIAASVSTSACYLVQKAHGEVLIGSSTEKAGFDVSVTPEAIQGLCCAAVRAVPTLGTVGIKRVWSGLRPGTPDELPILGPMDGVSGYVNATGGFRTGIVAAPLTARLVAQCITGEAPEVSLEPFLSRRFCQQEASVTPATAGD